MLVPSESQPGIGKGLSFPFRISSTKRDYEEGGTATSEGDARMNELIGVIMTTPKGSIPMARKAGYDGSRVIFYPILKSIAPQMLYYGNEAIRSFRETRFGIQACTADTQYSTQGYLFLNLQIYSSGTRTLTPSTQKINLFGEGAI